MNEDLMRHAHAPDGSQDAGLRDAAKLVLRRWRLVLSGAFGAGVVAFGLACLITPTFTARTTLLPPQQQQSTASAALSQLGALANLAGGSGMGIKSPSDQYIALMQSNTVSDRIIDEFKLMEVYKAQFRVDAREVLENRVHIGFGKKDALISVEVDDHDPKRAADMANSYVENLKLLTTNLAVTEAQQRRAFFEEHLKRTKDNLVKAEIALQASGITQGVLKSEPKAAAEGYATLRAETMSAEVKLHSMQTSLTPRAAELVQQQRIVDALHAQMSEAERKVDVAGDSDYIAKYREFKYQETLFELFARQYEMAKLDESREGAIIQVVDPATPPERKSRPKRAVIAIAASIAAGLLLVVWVLVRGPVALPVLNEPAQL